MDVCVDDDDLSYVAGYKTKIHSRSVDPQKNCRNYLITHRNYLIHYLTHRNYLITHSITRSIFVTAPLF